jgi:FMN-dependent oxidoreductase (nitrilotriacetate monooxygenase family)
MKTIRLNAFDTCAVTHHAPGLWRHPRDRAQEYTSLRYWTDYAQLLERGLFDGLFLADTLGYPETYGASAAPSVQKGVAIPKNDPAPIVGAMAAVTRHLGFGVTFNIFDEMPYAFARKISTLDHLTEGRIGWNIVTGYSEAAAKNRKGGRLLDHDERYVAAAEYMDIVYRLWECSWEDGAALHDKASGVYADPARVRAIRRSGEYFHVDGIHMAEPSPQRTPVLYQAGASSKGVEFAARHAECVFVSAPTPASAGKMVKQLRQAALDAGRRPDDLCIFALMTVIPAATDAEAEDKHADYSRYVDREAGLILLSGWTGVDFAGLDLNEPIKAIKTNAIQSVLTRFTVAGSDRSWTVGEAADFLGRNGGRPTIVGSPSRVADELQRWMDEGDLDGFNLTCPVKPESMADFIELVVPELQSRGVYKTAYEEGTLRDKLFGGGARTAAGHPSAVLRNAAHD